ncbi:MAG: hypothetical protein FJ149_12170 [Euryarchaeota archaeon]|nr:hypothetical protein [Euryarchaeota archaeon]
MPPPMMPPPPMMMPPPPPKSGAGTAAAVMYILGALFLLITMALGAMILSAVAASGATDQLPKGAQDILGYLWGVCVILPLIGMIFGFVGCVFIFQRKKFGVAMVGGVLGLIAGILSGLLFITGIVLPNIWGLLAFIFFLIGVILLFVAKKDFT